jgi:hypothetical protein
MCFSPTASFVTAGFTAVVGIISLSRVNEARELPLAATPLLFAFQQTIEGLLWLDLPMAPEGSIATGLVGLFLFFAEVFWPVYAPLAVWFIEPSAARRRLMLVCLAAGVGVSAYLLQWILTHPHSAIVRDGHIVYLTAFRPSAAVAVAYLAATGLPLLLSTRRAVVALGAVVLVGTVVAFAFYWEAFVSVWCFFAAATSLMILRHFEWSRRHRLRVASA